MTATNQVKQSEVNRLLWSACDTFRGVIDPSEYKNYILVMLFVKYISDVWRDRYEQYQKEYGDNPERIGRKMKRERAFMIYTSSAVQTTLAS